MKAEKFLDHLHALLNQRRSWNLTQVHRTSEEDITDLIIVTNSQNGVVATFKLEVNYGLTYGYNCMDLCLVDLKFLLDCISEALSKVYD